MYIDDVLYKGLKTSWGETMTISFGFEPATQDEIDFFVLTENIEVRFVVNNVDIDNFSEKLSLCLPFNKNFLLSLHEKTFSSEKEINFPPKSKEQKKLFSKKVERFVARGNKNKFVDYVLLKTQGRDEFSSMRLKELEEKIGKKFILEIKKENFDDKQKAVAYRWILRGLPLDMAIRKVNVDTEVAKNSVDKKNNK
jgi:hypothetical protein